MASLDDLRAQIDSIDSAIVDLLARRLQVCTEVAEIKAGTGAAIIQPARFVTRSSAEWLGGDPGTKSAWRALGDPAGADYLVSCFQSFRVSV